MSRRIKEDGHSARQREFLESAKSRDGRDPSFKMGSALDMGRLQEEASRYIRRIDMEKKKIEELDSIIARYQEKILEQKSRLGGGNAVQFNNQLVQKQIKVLESRMEKGLTKLNELLAANKGLRSKIDDYRRERVVFDGIYKKLEKELHEKKREMAAIIEDSKNAYIARDKSQNDMIALQTHSEKEKAEFEAEYKELGELIKEQQHMLEQARLKQFDTTNSVHKTKHTMTSSKVERKTEMTSGVEQWNGVKDKSIPLSQEKVFSYEDSLRKIQESTGINDINDIVSKFVEAEEQNFSLFNYVNDINTEIERLEHSISDMRNQIEKYRGQGMSTESSKKKILKDLEEKLLRTGKKAEDCEMKYEQTKRTINQLKTGILGIFGRIGANSTSVEELLGNQGPTESNMLQYLGIIEQRTCEILQQYAASQVGLQDSALQLPSPALAGAGLTKLKVEPPAFDEMSSGEDSDVDEDERPLTRQELVKRTLRDISKKGGAL